MPNSSSNESNGNSQETNKSSDFDTLKRKVHISLLTDKIIKNALNKKLSIEETLKLLLPALIKEFNCEGIFLKTYDENLKLKTFNAFKKKYENIPINYEEIKEFAKLNEIYVNDDNGTIISMRIDMSNDYFGYIGVYFSQVLDEIEITGKINEIQTSTNIINNYIYFIYYNYIKQNAIKHINQALQDALFDRAINNSVKQLYKYLKFDILIILFEVKGIWRAESGNLNKNFIKYFVFEKENILYDPESHINTGINNIISESIETINNNSIDLRKILNQLSIKLNLKNSFEMNIFNNTDENQAIGKVLISNQTNILNINQKEILYSYRNLITNRINRYNSKLTKLFKVFSQPVIKKLMMEEFYQKKYLQPVEKHVGILFCNISNFDKICHNILKEPDVIAELINEWLYRSVEIIWGNDGIIDNTFGNYIIGIFGPPFYEYDSKNICIKAIKTAIEINKWTEILSKKSKYKDIKESNIIPGLGVSIGINYCSVYLGEFGPNKDFMSFSKEKDFTLLLNNIAGYRDIFISENIKNIIGSGISGFSIGTLRKQKINNLKEAITYYPIIYNIDNF